MENNKGVNSASPADMQFYSNGKLLITGEYLVIIGAEALAMPVKFGQSLSLSVNDNSGFTWQTFVEAEQLLKCNFKNNLSFDGCNNSINPTFLQNVLKAAKKLSSDFENKTKGISFISEINFDINWGLGSSSSLISNIAYAFDIDPFELHFAVSKGSAYDIACARANSAIIYSVEDKSPNIKEISFKPDFNENIYFVYLGRKQDSSKSVRDFLKSKNNFSSELNLVSQLSKELIQAKTISDFNYLINEHEDIISSVLKVQKIKNQFFYDFEGSIKSLGAWGGDFIMVSSHWDFKKIKSYFAGKKLNTIFRFDEMSLA